jgi:DivIVA domain-containing protein
MRKKKTEDEAAPTPQPQNRQRLTPADIQQAEFRLSMRGYNEREVDELLDRLTEDWGAVLEENKRLREGVPAAAPASDDAVADAKREAEAILAKARQDAAEMVRNASQQTSAPVAPPAGVAEVAAVSSFLTKERDFLQSLGRLVQGHAESVKSMAQSSKAAETRQEARPAPAAQAPPKPAAQATAAQPKPAGDSAPARTERKPSEPPPPSQKTPETTGPPTQPVVKIDEENIPQPAPQAKVPTTQRAQSSSPASPPPPAPASSPHAAPEAAKQPAAIRIPEGGERTPATSAAERSGEASRDEELSLRELFWGDE